MFKRWGTWLGIKEENGQDKQPDEPVVNESQNPDIDKPCGLQEDTQLPERHQNVFFSDYMYNFASNASKKLSDSVVETAQTIKKSVGEGKINGIIDKTILGDFQKEQQKFVKEKKSRKSGAAVPPWVGFNEEETVQQQILALSADKRNFLRDPPAGVQFNFDCEQMYPVAMVMLEEDELLRKMRFHLVPKEVKEEAFWKNYFYRVSLIKQSAQLTALVAQQAAVQRDVDKSGASPGAVHQREENADWERELQEELQEYDVLDANENQDDNWDKEIEEMLKEDS
ncbi:synapse-associated protein 1-like isoform X2 [Brachionichthys hirsutus]|uniref:synapse-associated protein 1-like isoform X2 n=1 Tax=Brachionichthys hirsutus TaxID=412623 RepID=UPI0036054281